ncbi:MAG: T9SS type A sorting domain-containing protein [Ignavibacteriaceae bacterium]|nr:T9SS type A sorting domain-containing protein [Ignavibacteriaceae bacterium]
MNKRFSSLKIVTLFTFLFSSILTINSLAQNYWERTSGPGTVIVYDFLFIENLILIGTYHGGIYKTTNYGETWQQIENEFVSQSVYSLELLSNGNILAGTGSGIHISSDNGETWFYSALPDYLVSTITVDETDSIYIGSYYGNDIYRSGDNGINWYPLNSGINGVSSITIKNLNTILASASGRIYRSSDRGNSWTQVFAANSSHQIIDITLNTSGNFSAVSDFSGVFFLSTDEGVTWDSISVLPYSHGRRIYCSANGDLYAGSYGVYRSTNEGLSWNQLNGFQGSGLVRSIAELSNSIYAGTYFSGVFRSTDSGNNWSQSSKGINNTTVSLLEKDNNGKLYAVSAQAGLSSTSDNGENWKILGTMSSFNSFSTSPNGSLFGSRGSVFTGFIFRSIDSGNSWEIIYENVNDTTVTQVSVNIDGTVYAIIAHKLFKSTDNGDDWFHIQVSSINEFIQRILFNNIGYIYIQNSLGYFRSSDNGGSWVQLTSIPEGLEIFGITKSDDMFATASDSGYYLSTNYGDTWNYIFKGNGQLVRSFASNDIGYLFILVPSLGILRSTDNGYSWSEINSGLEGISLSCLIISDDDYLLVGTGWKGVYRSVNKTTSVEISFAEIPSSFFLEQNYPNPFNPITKIRYQVSQNANVSLKVFDVIGNEIKTLIEKEQSAGVYEIEFQVSELSSGIYFYQLKAGEFIETRKMILLK